VTGALMVVLPSAGGVTATQSGSTDVSEGRRSCGQVWALAHCR